MTTNPEKEKEQVEVPGEAVELAADRFEALLNDEGFDNFEFPESFMRLALQAAAPVLCAQERERTLKQVDRALCRLPGFLPDTSFFQRFRATLNEEPTDA